MLKKMASRVTSQSFIVKILYDSTQRLAVVITELLQVYLGTMYFQVDNKFLQQKDDMAMGSCLSPVVSNIFMEHFEKLALDSAQHKRSLWKNWHWGRFFSKHFSSPLPMLHAPYSSIIRD
jgi:hypothetical protein